jgi:integrase
MASLYKRSRSPFWWIKWRDERGKTQRESLGLRIGIGSETKRAREIRAERTLEEARAATSISRRVDKQDLVVWVPEWFRVRYSNSPLTLTKYQESWHAISAFFEDRKIKRAEQVRREDVISFVEWRQKPSSNSVRASSRNTALHDLKVLRTILYEAMRRGWANQNAAARLGLKADRSREKPEFSPEQINLIRAKLKRFKKPEWMKISFEIAMHQGCRIKETSLPLEDVNLNTNEITFTIKRGARHTTALHPALKPMFEKLRANGQKRTFDWHGNMSRDWARFFRRIGLKGYSFHCTRVTVVTRLARSGKVSEQQAMRFIGHANEPIHRIYQRLRTSDLKACLDAVLVGEDIFQSSQNPDALPAT